MEEQDILNLETGTKESISLEPKKVKIVKVSIKEVGEKKIPKAAFSVKHPDKEENIDVSSIKYENKGKLDFSGSWVNFDEDKKIRKGSALATFMAFKNVKMLKDFEGLEVETVLDEKGYICLKAY